MHKNQYIVRSGKQWGVRAEGSTADGDMRSTRQGNRDRTRNRKKPTFRIEDSKAAMDVSAKLGATATIHTRLRLKKIFV